MEKLDDFIKSFRISKKVKQILIFMAEEEEIEIQQMCRKILNKAAKEHGEKIIKIPCAL